MMEDTMKVRAVNMRHEQYDIKVDRSTRMGNPFRMNGERDRENVCNRFEIYVACQIYVHAHLSVMDTLMREVDRFIERNPDAKEIRLGCWCKPKRCHADALARLVKEKLDGRKNQAAAKRK